MKHLLKRMNEDYVYKNLSDKRKKSKPKKKLGVMDRSAGERKFFF